MDLKVSYRVQYVVVGMGDELGDGKLYMVYVNIMTMRRKLVIGINGL